MAKDTFRTQKAARQRRHDRSHRSRQDDADRRHPGRAGRQGPGQLQVVRRHRQGRYGPRRNQDRDDRRVARRVRDRQAALRPHRLPGPRRLHQEHDHRRRPDGRRDPGRVGRRRPDAADPRAHPAGPPGRRAAHRRVPEQGRPGRRPGVARAGRAGSSRAADEVRLPRRRDSDHPRRRQGRPTTTRRIRKPPSASAS